MVKRKKPPQRRKSGLDRLKSTPEEDAARDEEQQRGTIRGAGVQPLSSFGLIHSRATADYAASGGRDARITLRLHPDLRDLLIIVARRENRTLSQLVELALIDYAQLHIRRLKEADLRALGWDDAKIESLARDPHPFARHLYERLKDPL